MIPEFSANRKEEAMTKSIRVAVLLLVALCSAAALAQSDAQKSFNQLKSLAGSWEGKASDGMQVQVIFRETAGGSALMSEIMGHEDMITMFHLDGPNRLMMTHYCGTGNQPRMQASSSPDGKTITFTFVDATNLLSTQPGHMQQLVVTMVDPNHHIEDWAFQTQDGKLQQHRRFDLQRVQ
jgi:hypothetical protein